MYRFSQSKIIHYQEDNSFVQQIKNEFDLELVNIHWCGECPKKPENVLVRVIAPNGIIASILWRQFYFIDLFAGIGGIRLGFESVGGQCVFSSEWDTEAQKTYQANFGDKPLGDITKIATTDIPDHDILLAGFPCQPFSIIGKQQGFADTRGTLFFEIERILKDKQPTAFLLENVKQFKTHDNGRTRQIILEKLHKLGYHTYITVLNALDFGVAQKRERTIIVGFLEPLIFRFPEPYPYQPLLQDVLENDNDVDKKLFASEMICKKRLTRLQEQGQTPFYPSMWHENKGGHIGIHPFSCALRHNASYNYLLVNGNRRATGREMLRFQGFPESFKIPVDHSAIRAQAGNSVAVPVITAVAAEMMLALRNKKILNSSIPDAVRQRSLFEILNHGIEETTKYPY
jgi:DNA (cytosine-5)-methyltransferase 1